MNNAQNMKFVSVTPSATGHDNVALTTAVVDTKGFDYAQFYVYFGAINASALSVFNISEMTNSTGAGTAIIAGTNYASTAGITDLAGSTLVLPGATADGLCYKFEVDCKGRERYLDLKATVDDTTGTLLVSAFCLLSRGEQAPTTAAGMGCVQVARV